MTDTANTANEGEKPSFATANDLDFEMTPEQEEAFVKETLNFGEPVTEPKQTETKEENDDASGANGDDEQPKDADEDKPAAPTEDEAKDAPASETKTPVEEEKPTEADVPLELKTDDLWIEVEKVTTDEDGNQKIEKVKLVYDPEDPSAFIPDDFTFKSDKQLADILEAKAEMANLYKERKAEVDTKQAEAEQTKTIEQKQQEQLATWDAEIQDLIDNGILNAPKAKPEDKDFLEDESVKQIDAVFKFMAEQNEQRTKDGKPPIVSFGTAYTLYQKDVAAKAEANAEKEEQEAAKKKAALIGGSSASGAAEQKAYKPGSYSSIYEIPIDV